MSKLVTLIALGLLAHAAQEPAYSPARLRSGKVPAIPVTAVGGGEVLLDLDVSAEGTVTRATPLRSTPPFTELVVNAVREWQFFPARAVVDVDRTPGSVGTSRAAVQSHVLVAAVFRPPALRAPTLGEPPKDVSSGLDALPFPLAMIPPLFPPTAASNGVVLLEVHVTPNGSVDSAGVIHSAPPFDDAAVKAVRQWHFRPAQLQGTPVATYVYVVLGFRVPVAGSGSGIRDAGVWDPGPASEIRGFGPAIQRSAVQRSAIQGFEDQ
jgi:TonB family protein